MFIGIPLEDKNYKDLNPVLFGYESCESNHTFGPAIREYYLIHYIVNGKGTYSVNDKTYNVRSGEIFIIKPGEVTIYKADADNPWYYIWIGFNGSLAKRLDLFPPVLKLNSRIFFEMLECEDFENTKEDFLTSKLFMLFSILLRNEKKSNNYVKQATDYINTHYMKNLYVNDIAKLLKLDRGYFSRIFKKKMGISVQQYILSYRMEKAVDFLRQNYSVSQTAFMVGYNDPFNFSKMFKKTYGISPKYYYLL